jgi:hypothetical protein
MEALNSSETSLLRRATRRNVPEGTILHSHRREKLKFYSMFILINFSSIYKTEICLKRVTALSRNQHQPLAVVLKAGFVS